MSADVVWSHGSDGGGKGKRKPNLGGRAAGRLNTRDKTQNLSLKEITDTKGPVPIQFELRDKQIICLSVTMRLIVLTTSERSLGTQFDLRPHMESRDWTEINAGIQQHLKKAYNTNKAAFKAQHWVIDPTTGTCNMEKIRRERPENITASEWDKYIEFRNDPRNIARVAQNRQNRAKSTEEMRRLEAIGTYIDDEINRLARGGKQRGHIAGVGRVSPARATASLSTPAHDSTLNSLHKKVDFMISIFKSDSKFSDMFSQFESGGANGSGGCRDEEEGADHQDDEDEDGDVDT
nr:F-box domain, leucine-rich repeat domain, L domain-like protein [Tanacetum cinerariifolium]